MVTPFPLWTYSVPTPAGSEQPQAEMPVCKRSLEMRFPKGPLLGCRQQTKPEHRKFFKAEGFCQFFKITKKLTNSTSNLKEHVDIVELKLG